MKLHIPLRSFSAVSGPQVRTPEEQQILSYIKSARSDMEQAANLFNELTDSTAIDYASYSLLAARTRYEYLMKLAKERGLTI